MESPQRLDRVFQALSDATRRRILERLARGDEGVTELVSKFDISQPAVTKHLNVLERAGLITRRREGRRRRCRIRPAALRAPVTWAERCRRMWDERLDALETLLAIESKEEK